MPFLHPVILLQECFLSSEELIFPWIYKHAPTSSIIKKEEEEPRSILFFCPIIVSFSPFLMVKLLGLVSISSPGPVLLLSTELYSVSFLISHILLKQLSILECLLGLPWIVLEISSSAMAFVTTKAQDPQTLISHQEVPLPTQASCTQPSIWYHLEV